MTAIPLLTTDEVANLLRLQPDTVRKLAASGDLRAAKIGREWRYEPDDVDLFVAGKANRSRRKRRRSTAARAAVRTAVKSNRSGGHDAHHHSGKSPARPASNSH